MVIFQLMALLLLRHALTVTDADGDDDVSTFFSVSEAQTSSMLTFIAFLGYLLLTCALMDWFVLHSFSC